MVIELKKDLKLVVHGFPGTAINDNYANTAFALSGRTWSIVKANQLKNKGKNIWIYEPGHAVFAGVELDPLEPGSTALEKKIISLSHYAFFKHIGPYKLIGQCGEAMKRELTAKGFETSLPYLEIYGHWSADESKLETELLMNLKA